MSLLGQPSCHAAAHAGTCPINRQFLYFTALDLILLWLCNSVCVCVGLCVFAVVTMMLDVFISGFCGVEGRTLMILAFIVKYNIEASNSQFATRRQTRHVLLYILMLLLWKVLNTSLGFFPSWLRALTCWSVCIDNCSAEWQFHAKERPLRKQVTYIHTYALSTCKCMCACNLEQPRPKWAQAGNCWPKFMTKFDMKWAGPWQSLATAMAIIRETATKT